VSCRARHRASVRESAGNVRITCGGRRLDLDDVPVMTLQVLALQSKHTPHAFVTRYVVND
jgi:hypothetical protein